jgi:hypothetical protein
MGLLSETALIVDREVQMPKPKRRVGRGNQEVLSQRNAD